MLTVAVLLMGFRVFFTQNGKFPSIHIGDNKAMRDRGISCAMSQDREAQKENKRLDKKDIVNEIIENY